MERRNVTDVGVLTKLHVCMHVCMYEYIYIYIYIYIYQGEKQEEFVPMLVYSRNASIGTPATIEVKIVSSLNRAKIKASVTCRV